MTTQGEVRSLFPRRFVAKGAGLRQFWARRSGFTYIESMIALAVMSLAGAALLTSIAGAVSSSNDSVYRTIGRGLGEQLLDEIAAAKFPSGIVTATTSMMPNRTTLTTIDDYSGWTEIPPRTKSGELLGNDNGATGGATARAVEFQAAPGFVNRFTRSVLVERIQPGSSGWTVVTQHTSYRRVTVTVSYTGTNQPARPVAKTSRVFSSVAPSP